MSNHNHKPKPHNRTFFFAGIVVICAALVIGAAALIFSGKDTTPDAKETVLSSSPTGSEASSAPVTNPDTQPSTQPSTHPTEPPVKEVTEADVQALIAEADFIAAGYDYAKAISMLQSVPYYNDWPVLAEKVAAYEQADSELVVFQKNSQIRHVFFHSLIADTDRAFDGDFDSSSYNLYMTTIDEFNAILEQMYERGYVLISPYDMAYEVTDETGTHFTYGKIRLPEGKTPFLMSQDDVNYYAYMVSTDDGHNRVPEYVNSRCDGFAHKLVIGDDGFPTCEYMQKDGTIVTGDYDLVPILERFIQEHPDFSYHGARAMLAVTGFEGVFGYRTNPNYREAMGNQAFEQEVADAKELAQCLKDHGWLIVSHSYGHPDYGAISAERVDTDSTKWENTVQPIVGETDILIFPYGADIYDWHPIPMDNVKFNILYEDGYRYFFNVDSNIWNQLGTNHFRGGRLNLDGYVMYHRKEVLVDLFDVETVFDPKRPTPVPTL